MKYQLTILLFSLFLAPFAVAAPDTWVFFGCVGKDEPGIYRATLDSATGVLGEPAQVAKGHSMSFLALSPDRTKLYAVQGGNGEGHVSAFSVDAKTGELTKLNQEEIGSHGACHVSVTPDGKTVATADYGDGTIVAFGVNDDGSLKPHDPECFFKHEGASVDPKRQDKSHAHCMIPSPDSKFIYAADLGTDSIVIYAVKNPGEIALSKSMKVKNLGGGPRHIAFSKNGDFAFANLELTSEVTAFSVDKDSGDLHELATVSTLPDSHEGNSTSELLCHPSGRFFYCANRGHNSVAAFRHDHGSLVPIGHASSGGEIPRNLGISPDGGWIITSNQNSNNAGVIKIDQQSGEISLLEDAGIPLPKPMCARFLPMNK